MKRSILTTAFAMLLMALSPKQAGATTYTWTPLPGGTYNWDNASSQNNWGTGMGGPFPNAAGDVVILSLNMSGNQSINLNGDRTLGSLTIGDTDFSQLFTINAGSSLIFDNGGNPATLTKVASTYYDATCCTGESIASSITLASDLRMTNDSGYSFAELGRLRLDGGISGPGGMTKLGKGLIALGGGTANTYGGPTVINNGTLMIDTDNSIPDTSPVDIIATGASAKATLSVGYPIYIAHNERIGPLRLGGTTTTSEAKIDICGTLFLAGDVTYDATNNPPKAFFPSNNCTVNKVDLGGGVRTFTVAHSSTNPADQDLVIQAAVTNGAIVKEGLGGLHLWSVYHTFSGGVVIKNGIFNAWGTAGTGTITIGDTSGSNSALLGVTSGFTNFGNAIVVPGGNTGTATMIGTGYLTGPITMGSGALSPHDLILKFDNGAGAGTFADWAGNITGHGNLTVLNTEKFQSSEMGFLVGATINPVGSISFTGTGGVAVDAAIGSNVTAVIVNMADSADSSNVRLTGSNTYPAPTIVTSGTLSLDNLHAGGAPYTIATAGILAGTGFTNAAVSLSGTISPGSKNNTFERSAPGMLRVGAMTWSNGAHFAFDIDNAVGTAGVDPGWDLLDVNGALDMSGVGAGGFTIDVKSVVYSTYAAGDATNFNNQLDYAWPLVTFDSLVGTFDATKFVINSSAFTNPTGGGTFGIRQNGNTLELTFTAVAVCGDGFVTGSEACDDGNPINGDGCDVNCQMTGCGNGIVTSGEACDDGNQINGDGCDAGCLFELGGGCVIAATCNSGFCVDGVCCEVVSCSAIDQCHDAGTCQAGTGMCSNPTKADGSSCNDGDLCTQSDTCQSGMCTGANPVTCSGSDRCHAAGVCNPATGMCSNPNMADGSACDDLDECTQLDLCQSGICVGTTPVTCSAIDECHEAGTCKSMTGMCSKPPKADGTPCTNNGTCQIGACVPRCSSNADCPNLFECIEQRCYPLTEGPLDSASGCACSVPGENGSSSQTWGTALVALGVSFARRRRRMKRRNYGPY